MEKKQINKETLEIIFPKILPHKGVTDFFKSKANLSQIRLREYEWDKPRHDPFLHLTASRRIYEEIEEALADKREFYKGQRVNLDLQWKDLREKEETFKQSFQKLSSFVVINKDKRERAKDRYQEDKKLRMKRSEEAEKLKETIEILQASRVEMDKQVKELLLYEKFLKTVVEKSDSFKNMHDLINRYESLITTKNDLGLRQNNFLGDLENAISDMEKMSNDYRLRILGLNNVVGSLNARFNQALNKAMHWESTVYAIKNNAFDKFQEINEVKQACRNIYMLMCKRKGEALKISEDNFEEQLNYIKETLHELKVVREEAKMTSKKTFSSIKGETSKVS